MNDNIKRRTPGKRVFGQAKPRLTLVPSVDTSADSVAPVELSVEVKEMLREMQQRKRARREELGGTASSVCGRFEAIPNGSLLRLPLGTRTQPINFSFYLPDTERP